MISSFETLFFEILIATRQHKSNGRKATLNSSNANAVKPLLIINGQCVKPDLKKMIELFIKISGLPVKIFIGKCCQITA